MGANYFFPLGLAAALAYAAILSIMSVFLPSSNDLFLDIPLRPALTFEKLTD
jgi:hypothetical protein